LQLPPNMEVTVLTAFGAFLAFFWNAYDKREKSLEKEQARIHQVAAKCAELIEQGNRPDFAYPDYRLLIEAGALQLKSPTEVMEVLKLVELYQVPHSKLGNFFHTSKKFRPSLSGEKPTISAVYVTKILYTSNP